MQPGQPEMESVSPAHRSHADMTQTCYEIKNAFKSMLRLSIAAVLTLSGVLAFAPEAHAKKEWKEDMKLSKEYAGKEKWKKACSYAVSAGAAMDEAEALTIDYMGKIGKRCTEAAN